MTADQQAEEQFNRLREIATDEVAPAADDLDRDGAFPTAAVEDFRAAKLLSAALPCADGGLGWSLRRLADGSELLGRRCASTAMVWAMQHSQVLSLVAHSPTDSTWSQTRRQLAETGALIASVASEPRSGSDYGAAQAVMQLSPDGTTAQVEKRASGVSYGMYADAYLVSCRRAALEDDLAFVFAWRSDCDLSDAGAWSGLGMRGTATVPMTLRATFRTSQVLDTPFSAVMATMAPVAHILWSAAWEGIAGAAVHRSDSYLRTSRTASRSRYAALEAARANVSLAQASTHQAIDDFEARGHSPVHATRREQATAELLASAKYNRLKLDTSSLCVEAVMACLNVVGLAGYTENSPWAQGRAVRDILSAPLMVSNFNLIDVNADIERIRHGV